MRCMVCDFEQTPQATPGEHFIVRDATDAARMKHIFYELPTVPEIHIVAAHVF